MLRDQHYAVPAKYTDLHSTEHFWSASVPLTHAYSETGPAIIYNGVDQGAIAGLARNVERIAMRRSGKAAFAHGAR